MPDCLSLRGLLRPLVRAGVTVAVAAAAVCGVLAVTAKAGRPLHHARPAALTQVPTYREVAADGGIFTFGGSSYLGSMGGRPLNRPIVGMTATADGGGYWEVASDGGIFAFGDARFHGSMGGRPLNRPIVGMAVDPGTGGYWEVASDGGIFAFDAPFHGSMGGRPLNRPIVGMAPTADGGGYWEVASDGGIFAFGDARFHGSMGGRPLNRPIVGMAADTLTGGYWEVASDGGIFAFDAPFLGSMGGANLSRPIVAIAATPDAHGYWEVAADGGIFTFGDAGFYGSMGGIPLNAPVVGMALAPGTGIRTHVYLPHYPSGSYGVDVSKFQDNASCTGTLPAAGPIRIVETNGMANAYPNPCLSHEARWAGNDLNLYTFLSYGTSAANEPGCNGDQACNFGYQAARYAVSYAASQGVDTNVVWWLDVEGAGTYWSSNPAANAQVVTGALLGLHAAGPGSVGIYTSVLGWNPIVGSFQPDVPLWVAWYTGNPTANCANALSYGAAHGDHLPTGGLWLTQYTSNGGSLDGDYAC